MFHDLNVPFTTATDPSLPLTLSFLSTLNYRVVALNHTLPSKLPAQHTSPILSPLPFPVPPTLTILTRLTLPLAAPVSNARLKSLASGYDLLALRPADEKTLQACCSTLECDIISLDLSQRLGFPFRFKPLSEAIKRGVRIEICYAQGTGGDAAARRNVSGSVMGLVMATRGRGLVVSSEVKGAGECRGPWDVVNLVGVWGLGRERGFEAVSAEAARVVRMAGLRRRGWRGVVDLVENGEEVVKETERKDGAKDKTMGKRKVDDTQGTETDKLSKTQMKKRAKKAREEAAKGGES